MVYGWGNGANGRLGNESDDYVTEPKVLECFREATQMGLMQIRQISSGENHTLALVDMILINDDEEQDEEEVKYGKKEDKEEPSMVTKLFVWGNNDKRQLGIALDHTSESGGGTADDVNSSSALNSDQTLHLYDIKVPL